MNCPKFSSFLLILFFGFGGNVYSLIQQNPNFLSEPKALKEVDMRGIPSIIHYTKNDFNADPQFWTMCEDEEGVIYLGNNDGALVFDGENWQKVFLPNGSSVRSLLFGHDGQVYAGGYNEFGKIKKDRFGNYYFESMLSLLDNNSQNFETVWDILQVQDFIVFRTFKMLIAVENLRATILPSDQTFTFSQVIEGKLYVEESGTLKYLNLKNLQYQMVFDKSQIRGEELVAMLDHNEDEFLLVTKQGSIFILSENGGQIKWKKDIIPKNSNNLVTCAMKSSKGLYYLGTLSTKTIILDDKAEKLALSQAFELQDQTVLNIYESNEGNIWALLNNGLDCIDLASPVTNVFNEASVYDVHLARNRVFVASNQGVYMSNVSEAPTYYSGLQFSKITGMDGQAWAIDEFKGRVVASHDKGVFVFNPDGSNYKVTGISGIWKVIPLQGKPNHFLACGYDGLYILKFEKTSGRFQFVQKIDGFGESSRDILQSGDPHVFWVCHGYKGVYRIRLNQEFTRVTGLEQFSDQNGFPSPYSINVFSFAGQTVFTTNHGIFTYDEAENQFVPFDTLNSVFGFEKNVRNLQLINNRLWFVHDDEAGYVDLKKDLPEHILQKDLFMALKGEFNRSMECILPINDSLVMMGTRRGLFAFDLAFNKSPEKKNILFTKIQYTKNHEEIQAEIGQEKNQELQIPTDASNLLFAFAIPGFKEMEQIQYAYMLEGTGQDWSDWITESSVDFNFLQPGEYRLLVKARSRVGELSEVSAYTFSVLPKWYQTSPALTLISLLALIFVYLGILGVKRKIKTEKEKARIDQAEKTKVLELELQQMKLENEKRKIEKDKEILEEDVLHKSKELANYTLLLVKKKDLLNDLHNEIKGIRESATGEKAKAKLGALQHRIQSNLSDEEHLQVFDTNFERVHQTFFNELKTAYPTLSTKEVRLCAFVKMNLSNKEIASMLNISVRGVETARYRLRKRLSLDHDINMVEFLDSLSAAELEDQDENRY